ncbi:right-handed parallel beta-helix repeat-containing protein [Planctomycetota bacterium]
MFGPKGFIALVLVVGVCAGSVAWGQSVQEKLQQGLQKEEVLGDLRGAAAIYEEIVKYEQAMNGYAAQALYRLGMCHLMAGEKAEAVVCFGRVVTEYPFETSVSDKAKRELEKLNGRTCTPGNLQAVIDAARVDDTIIMGRGTYTKPVKITKAITLRGVSREDCVLNVIADEPAIYIDKIGEGTAKLENLTIKWQLTNTTSEPISPCAVTIVNSKAEIEDCFINGYKNFDRALWGVNNKESSQVNISRCRFEGFYHGICFSTKARGKVADCLIMNSGHHGIRIYPDSEVEIVRNVICGSAFHGVRCNNGTLLLKDNLIIENDNRGVYLEGQRTTGLITNNVVMRNDTGIGDHAQSTIDIENNIIMENQFAGLSMYGSTQFTVKNNIFQSNRRAMRLAPVNDGENRNTILQNTLWDNEIDYDRFYSEPETVRANLLFIDPENGDFAIEGYNLNGHDHGLTDPGIFKILWQRWLNRNDVNEPFGAKQDKAQATICTPENLQAAVDGAQPGETIILSQGIYTQPVVIAQGITLKGVSRRDCIFEVTANEPALFINTMGKGDVKLENLTIKWQVVRTNTEATYPSAVRVIDTNVDISDCNFKSFRNFARAYEAVFVDGSSTVTISGSSFEGFQYAICFGVGTRGKVHDCLIMDSGDNGFFIYPEAELDIIRNVIGGSRFHGVLAKGAKLNIRDNLIIENMHRGIYLEGDHTSGAIVNNVFYKNDFGLGDHAQAQVNVENNVFYGSDWVGVYMYNTSRLTVKNNIFEGNQRAFYKSLLVDGENSNTLLQNTLWNNTADFENIEPKAAPLREAPLFVDPENGNFAITNYDLLKHNQGLTNPDIFKVLWKRWENRHGLAESRAPVQAAAEAEKPVIFVEPIKKETPVTIFPKKVIGKIEAAKADIEKKPLTESKPKEMSFELAESSVFNLPSSISGSYQNRLQTPSKEQPDRAVKSYPEFKSNKPKYGAFHTWSPGTSHAYYFALDESGGTGSGYDRLYFDVNGDLDLTNDIPVGLRGNPWKNNPLADSMRLFEFITIKLDMGDGQMHPVEIMPCLYTFAAPQVYLGFQATKIRKGIIDLEGNKYEAILGSSYEVNGRYDSPNSQISFIPLHHTGVERATATPSELRSLQNIGGEYYHCSATAFGDKLTIRPFEGKFGIFEVGPGDRDISRITVDGELYSGEITIPIKRDPARLTEGKVSYEVPVGDYIPQVLSFQYGNLSLMILANYHDYEGVASSDRLQHNIKIREDKPFVLDFSNEPKIEFVTLQDKQRVKVGTDLMIDAVLIDPEVDFKFRLISAPGEGQLDPTVTIRRTNGEKVGEGVMPFG